VWPHIAKGLRAEEGKVRRNALALWDEVTAVPVVRPHPRPLQPAVEQHVARLLLHGLHPTHHMRHARTDRQKYVAAATAAPLAHLILQRHVTSAESTGGDDDETTSRYVIAREVGPAGRAQIEVELVELVLLLASVPRERERVSTPARGGDGESESDGAARTCSRPRRGPALPFLAPAR
jgi:hypothetical protein